MCKQKTVLEHSRNACKKKCWNTVEMHAIHTVRLTVHPLPGVVKKVME